jgi:hypothetical protein
MVYRSTFRATRRFVKKRGKRWGRYMPYKRYKNRQLSGTNGRRRGMYQTKTRVPQIMQIIQRSKDSTFTFTNPTSIGLQFSLACIHDNIQLGANFNGRDSDVIILNRGYVKSTIRWPEYTHLPLNPAVDRDHMGWSVYQYLVKDTQVNTSTFSYSDLWQVPAGGNHLENHPIAFRELQTGNRFQILAQGAAHWKPQLVPSSQNAGTSAVAAADSDQLITCHTQSIIKLTMKKPCRIQYNRTTDVSGAYPSQMRDNAVVLITVFVPHNRVSALDNNIGSRGVTVNSNCRVRYTAL